MKMESVVNALECPLCGRILTLPTTLHCGHSLCSAHLHPSNFLCPLPACPNLPAPALLSDIKPDVTLNKILFLLHRLPHPNRDPDTDTDSDHHHHHHTPPPRKRRRTHPPQLHHNPDLLAHLSNQSRIQRATPSHVPLADDTPSFDQFQKDLSLELNCEICFAILYQPVTTPCQHTFCAKCLHRSLDHSNFCPLCRQDLPGFSYFQNHPPNAVLLKLLTSTLPDLAHAYATRAQSLEAEERHARLDTPIFVCQLSFPGMPTLLHLFEPRYRLMLRRCLESPTPSFGMIMPPKPASSPSDPSSSSSMHQIDYGTMLEIRSVQMLSDGRSMVETWGTFRFRILERGLLDGYMVGRIERIDDFSTEVDETRAETEIRPDPENPPAVTSPFVHLASRLAPPDPESSTSHAPPSHSVPLSTQDLISHCVGFLSTLQTGTAPWVSQRLSYAYGFAGLETILNPASGEGSSSTSGPLPPPSILSFYIATLLPIDDYEKAKLLPIKSARMRLQMCVWWIEGLRRHWWFDKGCTVL